MEVVLREDSSEEIQNEAAHDTDLPPWELQETQWTEHRVETHLPWVDSGIILCHQAQAIGVVWGWKGCPDTCLLTSWSSNSQYCRFHMDDSVLTQAYVLLYASSHTQSGKHCWRDSLQVN